MEIDKDRFAAMLEDLANITPETMRTVLIRYVPNYHPAPPEQGNTHKGIKEEPYALSYGF